MPSYGGREAWKNRRVRDWNEFGACLEDTCGAGPGEACMSPKRPEGKWGGRRKRVTAHPFRPKRDQLYPMHAHLADSYNDMDAILGFLAWLKDKKEVRPVGNMDDYPEEWLPLEDGDIGALLDDYLGIDRGVLELEKKAIGKASRR